MNSVVTVVTPTYNMVDRLPRCVASVAAQTWGDVEHIVVDGGSTDGTVEFLATQPHLRWISEKDSGQSDAINKGFVLGTGEILTWLNADDTLSPTAAETAVRAFGSDSDLGLVYGDLEVVSGTGRKVVKHPPSITPASFRRGNVISQPGTFFTARAFEAAGGIDETFDLAMDFELWLRMLMGGVRTRYVPEVLASFEVHPQSKTGSQGMLAFAQEEARALQKHGRHHDAAMAIDRWFLDDALGQIVRALHGGDMRCARAVAQSTLGVMHPAVSRSRAFLWAARLAPALARFAIALKRHRLPDTQ